MKGAGHSEVCIVKNMMKFIQVCLVIFTQLSMTAAFASSSQQEPIHILVIDSYTPMQPWSQRVLSGLTKAKQNSGQNIELYVEYMDDLRLERYRDHVSLFKYIYQKYKDITFSGIVANSDSAAAFVKDYGTDLVGTAPKALYAAQQDLKPANDSSYFSLWADIEESVRRTADMALAQNPDAHSVVIIKGTNAGGRKRAEQLQRYVEKHSSLSVHMLANFSMQELRTTIGGLDRNAIVFYTPVFSDTTGLALTPKQVVQDLVALSAAPIYSLWDTFMGTGIVGGHIIDGGLVGENLLSATLNYLQDEQFAPPDASPHTALKTLLDWRAADHYGIDVSDMMQTATVINQPLNVWVEYRREIIVIGVSLLVVALSAVFWLHRLARMNAILQRSRDDLDQRVKDRTGELTRVNDALADNERRFRALSDASFEGIVISKNGFILEANNALYKLTSYQENEVINRHIIDFIVHEERENVQKMLMSTHDLIYETAIIKKDGSVFTAELHAKTFSYQGHWVRVTAIRDITEQRDAQNALEKANRQLREMAVRDGLTGIANRRHFDEILDQEWRRACREGCPLSLLMIDVDHFKAVNDMYGHQAGDDVLRRLAAIAASHVRRSGDLVARYGGEEFVVLLQNTDEKGALRVAETLREAVRHAFESPDAETGMSGLTISVGAASTVPTQGQDASVLVKAADSCLYTAKETGRNRVVGTNL